MKKVQLKNNGQFTNKDLNFFGGKYNLMQRLKMDGVGSSKVIYKSGIPYFDELSDFVENEIPFANFELMKDGLLVRLNRNQKTRIVGFQLHEILSVRLLEKENKSDDEFYRLKIRTLNDNLLQFEIYPQYVNKIQQFFRKEVFVAKRQF